MQAQNGQIRQMVNFILQEAHEKANEIRIKTEHDFNIEKQTMVHNAKLSMTEEFKGKERAREVEDRIARSSAVGDARITKMKLRDELLEQLIETARASVAASTSTPNYPDLIKKLIIQGLIKIEEREVVVLCRQADVPIAMKVLPDAVKEFKDVVFKETGQKLDPVVKVNQEPKKMLDGSSGGVILTAHYGRIVLDNTLDARINLVYTELLPKIREQLWEATK